MGGLRVGRWLIAAAILAAFVGPAGAAPVARDGPFGIAMGEPLSELGPLEKLGEQYKVLSPPRPSPGILVVTVEAFPSTGVCMITGVYTVNHNDPNGVAAKQLVDQLADILASKYGEFKKLDQCNNNSATCEQYLTQAFENHSATYLYGWMLKGPRLDHLLALEVVADALDANSTTANIRYFSDNADACAAAEKGAASSSF
jgi:hypothetical protein